MLCFILPTLASRALLVHNDARLRECGFFFPGSDIDAAAAALRSAIAHLDGDIAEPDYSTQVMGFIYALLRLFH